MTSWPVRTDRSNDALRPVTLEPEVNRYAEGSCLVRWGHTIVWCTASLRVGGPAWREGGGWVTAEYAMLPRATHTRSARERQQQGGRTHEIQRLIGRCLRACVDLDALAGWTIVVDCDVLQADGGTRTASITGGAVALWYACRRLVEDGAVAAPPWRGFVAAVSVGCRDSELRVDLAYEEDAAADVDLTVAGIEQGGLVDIHGAAEGRPFQDAELAAMVALAWPALRRLHALQRAAVGA